MAKNLRLGRFLTMIVGDRIRQSLVGMLNHVSRYPHLATNVALVEMQRKFTFTDDNDKLQVWPIDPERYQPPPPPPPPVEQPFWVAKHPDDKPDIRRSYGHPRDQFKVGANYRDNLGQLWTKEVTWNGMVPYHVWRRS